MSNVTAWERIPARPAQYADPPSSLDQQLVEMLHRRGLSPLYTHQALAVEATLNEQNVVLATGTASGKSLAYHLATLQFILQKPGATALYLFPTKALAQDQDIALSGLIETLAPEIPITHNLYDGDTRQSHRTRIRRAGGILISNPDMLHMGILPYHTQWSTFFSNLRLVVLDEMHTYRGVFGSHVANVIRRLRRICRFYGSEPLFFCSSATVANPGALAERLIEAPVALVCADGSPTGERNIILYSPPVLDERSGLRRSYLLEASTLTGRCLAAGAQTIIFARTRQSTEILLGYIKDVIAQGGLAPVGARGYRGGYLPLERREIERGLRDGEVRAVVATNALELGIDIGSLGTAILAGYPGTIASTWQQLGRAGRRSDVSVGILVASAMPLDQYVVRHPRFLFEQPPERALLNPDNLAILVNHLRCAVYELPFERHEAFGSFEDADSILNLLAMEGEIHTDGLTYRWIVGDYPAAAMSLRTVSSQTIAIQDCSDGLPQVIGQVDRESAPAVVYDGAIYLHEGRQFIIEKLDWENGIAYARRIEVDYYTVAGSSTSVQIEEEYASEPVGGCIKTHGRAIVTHRATGYRSVRRYTHETLGFGEIILPPQQFETTAYWIVLTPELVTEMVTDNVLLKPNDYGPDWSKQRDKARARDGFRCAHCKTPEHERRQHDVHHIRPFREFGYIPGKNEAYQEANHLDNLTTLCPNCHRTVEAIRHARSALAGLATILHNLAPLFLMCSPGDIGVVSEQKSIHTGLPTITIYDHIPGGLGLSEQLYDLHSYLLKGALDMVSDCPCIDGCPACIGPPGELETDTKELTAILVQAMIAGRVLGARD
ncbi:MAG: DEAD/DEAH box helicase [Anaerolineae bacterium]|nr:DEAD/DEAH box helicase [Anaerolineae bacterium]